MSGNSLQVGVGKAEIQIPHEIFPIENFGGIHDRIYVRALIMKVNVNVVIISLELTSLKAYELDKLKEIAADITKISQENIWICVTHTFNAPHVRSKESQTTAEAVTKNEMLCQAIEDALSDALKQSLQTLKQAAIGSNTTSAYVNANRDIETANGWWLGINDSGNSDKSVEVLRFDDKNGQPIAVLYNYNVQSSIMDGSLMKDGCRLVSGDLAGAASRFIESEYSQDFVALFCLGAAGDQAPMFKSKHVFTDRFGNPQETDLQDDGWFLVDLLGRRLANQVVQVMERTKAETIEGSISKERFSCNCPGQQIPPKLSDLRPAKSYEYVKGKAREAVIEIIRLGDTVIVGLQAEIISSIASEIKAASPFRQTMVCTMVNGGEKYLADKAAYERNTYEAMNSYYACGAAEILTGEIIRQLNHLSMNRR